MSKTAAESGRLRSFAKSNALSLVFGGLFLTVLFGQLLFGLARYNEEARTAGAQEISVLRYATSSSFAVDVTENWQSEFFQFALYIVLTVWLVQKGSSESKRPGEQGLESDEDQLVGGHAERNSPRWARVGGWRTAVYSHSLLLLMTAIFITSWTAQAIAGNVADNELRLRDLAPPHSLGQYVLSPDFWNRTLQNWQSELLAIGSMAVFAIYLRERGSPESKKVGEPHTATGSG